MRVLLIDDEITFCYVQRRQLERLNYQVEVAYNGIEGLSKINDFNPDVILLDMFMPVMNGWQFLDEYEYQIGLKNVERVPVVMITGSILNKEISRGLNDKRLTGILTKPYEKRELTMVFQKCCQLLGREF